jgi:hypothetical protein
LGGAGGAVVTTMLDYNGLPDDFPGMNTRPNAGSIDRVVHVEQALREYFGERRDFLPYLSLHEFEALLFSSPDELPQAMIERHKAIQFAAIRKSCLTPEDIDETYWPSHRILGLFHQYRKALHGPLVATRIGLVRLRSECPHFAEWIGKLERYARS